MLTFNEPDPTGIVNDVSEMFNRITPVLDTSCTDFSTDSNSACSGLFELGENYTGQVSITFDPNSDPNTLYLATGSGIVLLNWVSYTEKSTFTTYCNGPIHNGLYYYADTNDSPLWSLTVTCVD